MSAPQAARARVVTLTYDRDDHGRELSPPHSLPVPITPELSGVLARAASIPQNGPPLSFSSLLIGMLTGEDALGKWLAGELARRGLTMRSISAWRHLSFDEAHLRSVDPESVPDSLAMTTSARQAIAMARTKARELESAELDIRHLAAAYPVLPDTWHAGDFEKLGIDRLEWARALGAFAANAYPREKAFWREYANRASPVPLTSFSADVYTERDLLGIDRSVDALALLMASTRTDTPLAIGVFGPWGSGKSFFMRHLRQRICELPARDKTRAELWQKKRREKTATLDDAPLYYSAIAQVDFNAWHYNEGNIVASLIDHMFRNLRVGSDDKELERRRVDTMQKITAAQADAVQTSEQFAEKQKEVKAAKDEVDKAQDEVTTVRQDLEAKTQELQTTTSEAVREQGQLDAAMRRLEQLPDALDPGAVVAVALGEITGSPIVAEAREAARSFVRASNDWTEFFRRVATVKGLVVVGLCLSVPLVAMAADWLNDYVGAALAALATAGAGIKNVLDVVRERRRTFEAKLGELQEQEARRLEARRGEIELQRVAAKREWDAKLQQLSAVVTEQRRSLSRREEAVAAAARALTDRTRELDEKVKLQAVAQEKLRTLEAELKRLSSALLLDEFLRDRIGTDQYRKELGFLALVRRDFERLSDLIAEANQEWCSPEAEADPPALNRIVLYIDDLDRCKVETVIKVLEVVHLLLAFPLFVCVVAVDPRWIEKCLRDQHQHLFVDPDELDDDVRRPAPNGKGTEARSESGANGRRPQADDDARQRVTVGDYLEKIFQIPIWMSPIEPTARATVVKSLLGATAAPEPKGAPEARPHEQRPAPAPPPRAHAEAPVDGFQAAVDKAEERPDPLRITSDEARYLDHVAPLLSDKPRALKRFVNTYRLLKASLPDIDRQTFVTEDPSSPHKICIAQLALFTGRPRLAPTLVRALEPEHRKSGGSVAMWAASLPDDPKRAALQRAIGLIPGNADMSLDDFTYWLPDTSKYLFHRD